MHLHRAPALALAATLLVLPGVLAPSTAQAAVGCHGNACDGKSPKATGCASDAKTIPGSAVPRGDHPHVRAWLRYSKACHAVWAQADQSNGWEFGIQIRNGSSYNGSTVMSGPAYTSMVGADHEHRVRLRDADDGQWDEGPWRKGGI